MEGRDNRVDIIPGGSSRAGGQRLCASERVKHELTDFLLGKNIEVATGTAKRSFGRSIGVLYANGINVNEWLVESGYAERVDHA